MEGFEMKIVVASLFLLFCSTLFSPTAHGQQVFLEDDFEDYLDDLEVEEVGEWGLVEVNEPLETGSKWTITNPGGRVGPPSEDEDEFSQFMISDSDASGAADEQGSGMSHDLHSPVFETTGSDVVWLHFDCTAILNNNGLGVFDVDVSTDQGVSWSNVFRRVAPTRIAFDPVVSTENCNAFHGRLHLDLSEFAANSEFVQFRVRQFEPDDEWWIAVDNVLVDDQPGPQDEAVNLLSEGFSSGIPDDWTIRSEVGNAPEMSWTNADDCTRNLITFNGGTFPDGEDGRRMHRIAPGFAIIDPGCTGSTVDDFLITPAIDFSRAARAAVSWKEEILGAAAPFQVLLSLDGGETFEETPIFSFDPSIYGGAGDEDPFYAERIFELPDAPGEPSVAIAFRYTPVGEPGWVAIDDVKISADVGPVTCASQEFQVAGYDAETNSVEMNWKGVEGDTGYRILANGVLVGEPGLLSRSFTHSDPDAGASIAYTLETLQGAEVSLTCSAPAIDVFRCPSDLTGCTDQAATSVALSWTAGVNLAGTALSVRRDGVEIASLALDATSHTDASATPGAHRYEIALSGAEICGDLGLTYGSVIAGGDTGILFAEDFDCLTSDADVTAAGWNILDVNEPIEDATWTIANPGGRVNPPTADGTASGGQFMISDSDAAGGNNTVGSGMSHDLWSPVIDATNANEVWLGFDCSAQLNNNGFAVFDVDVSADDGASWDNVFRRVAPGRTGTEPFATQENTSGFYGRLDIDLSEFAAGDNFRFRVRQFEPEDDWWIAIDSVVVRTTPPPAGGAVTILEEETFEDGLIPDDWQNFDLEGDDGQWVAEDFCLRYQEGFVAAQGVNHLTGSFAIADSDCVGTEAFDEFLVTPELDCSEVSQVFLHFDSELLISNAAIEEVLVSVDGGETFLPDPVFSYAGGGLFDSEEESYFASRIIEVPAAAGQSKVAFAFHYRSGAGAAWWAVSNVSVSGTGTGGGTSFRRGDSDNNGSVNITDPIGLLNHLFAGAAVPVCLEAADTNGDSQVNIADPVNTLNFLFSGGDAPVAPGPTDCGEDPDEAGSVGCETYTTC